MGCPIKYTENNQRRFKPCPHSQYIMNNRHLKSYCGKIPTNSQLIRKVSRHIWKVVMSAA